MTNLTVGMPGGTINIECVPLDEDWDENKEINTVDFGNFYPGEIKTVHNDPRVQRLIDSGEFKVTEEDANSDEIRQDVAERLAQLAADKLEDEPKANKSPVPDPNEKAPEKKNILKEPPQTTK